MGTPRVARRAISLITVGQALTNVKWAGLGSKLGPTKQSVC